MKILLAGGSGFVGSALINALKSSGHDPTLVTRNPEKQTLASVGWSGEELTDAINRSGAVINLAGEPVIGKRWNNAQKENLKTSRVGSTQKLVHAMKNAQNKPKRFINASAIGFYGPRGDEFLSEEDSSGNDFLAGLSRDWEKAAFSAKDLGIRTSIVRIGIVLGKEGGALVRMLPVFRLGLGGRLGKGRQFMSWIHIADLARLFLFILEKEDCEGVFNGAAPNPVTNLDFTNAFGKALGRPAFLPVPGLVLRLALGEVAEVILTGQRVIPKRAAEKGFEFLFPTLEAALGDLL